MRSRGSSLPRLVNFSRAASARSRTFCSTSRKVVMWASMASALVRKSSDWELTGDSSTCIICSSVVAQNFRGDGPMKAVVGLVILGLRHRPDSATLRSAAIYPQAIATNKRRTRAEQKTDGRADFRLGTHALDRDIIAKAADPLLHVLGIVVHATGSNPARSNRIHPNAGSAPLNCGRLGKVHHPGSGRAGVTHAGHTTPHIGHDIDDSAPGFGQRLGV